ncbi:hypothetical protein ACLKA7_000236 [Drosophila subpalustris]
MCDVEKAIKGNQSNHDNNDDDQQQQQQQHHHHHHQEQKTEEEEDEEQLQLNNDVKSTSLATSTSSHHRHHPTASKRCLAQLLKLLFSSPGLVLLVAGYSVLGALIFPLLEAPEDLSKSAAIAKSREDCLRELWIITEKLNVLYERNWTMLVHEQLRRFEGSIVAATRPGGGGGATGGGGGGGATSSQLASALGHFGYDTLSGDTPSWTFSEALLYSVTVITTIGHGSLTPRTAAGKLATIFYALFGVPLMLMCLSSLGALLAEALQCTYIRLCCQLQRSSAGESEKKATGAMSKRRHPAGNGASCKGCKYDVANKETSLNECYEYGQKTTSTGLKRSLSLEQAEDACQLLRSAMPSKLNQQQQQQQQFYHQQQQQQQPDVMLMTTTTTGNTLLKYAPLPQQHQRHATQQHLQQQQHYINAAQQQQQQLTQQQQQQQQPQNFVAVPSSLLRFSGPSTLPLNAAAVGPPNCYAPATATIYFPFAPATSSPAACGGASNCHQPLVKYHTIHLQPAAKQQHRLLATLDTATQGSQCADLATATATTTTLESITLPPPPAYQTANMHAVRRAKFVTQPLAHEINTLLNVGGTTATGSSDLSCRHDLLPTALSTAATTSATATGTTATTANNMQLSAGIKATATATAATMPDNSFIAAGVCDVRIGAAATSAAATPATTATAAAAATLSALLSSSGNVDIMEDEDEQERERSSNCPHGTPSRVPLIASTGCSSLTLPHELPLAEKSSRQGAGNQARGLLNATAASFHRHTLQPLNRKTLLLTRRCQKHATSLYDATGNTETSDDDEEYMQHGSEQFVLKKLKHSSRNRNRSGSQDCCQLADDDEDDEDKDEADDDDEDELQRQVPISLVLLILMCYVCVGTVIFALWENWSLIDGAYFCFVTLSTIGYGDFVPARSFNGPDLQLYVCCAYLLLGLVLVAMSFSILETQLMWKCKRIAVRLKLASD